MRGFNLQPAVLVSVDVDSGSCVVSIPDEHGAPAELTLEEPYSSPQFLPEVGGTVVLAMQDNKPRILPQKIAVDAISAREARFDLVTTMLLYGAQIIFGNPAGNHGVLDSDGMRLVKTGGTVTVDLNTPTGDALFTGTVRSALTGARFQMVGNTLTFFGDEGPTFGTITTATQSGKAQLKLTGAVSTGGLYSELDARSTHVALTYGISDVLRNGFHADSAQARMRLSAGEQMVIDGTSARIEYGSTRVEANATGVGFNGSAPVAKPAVTGSRGGNAALASLLTALASEGLITDSTTA